MTPEEKIDYIVNYDEEMMIMDGFDHCILGVCSRIGQPDIVAYDLDAVMRTLIEREGMTEEDAIEYFEYNQIGAYVGERTPCFVKGL